MVGRRKPTTADIHLQGVQDELRHWQGPVATGAECHEGDLVSDLSMSILPLLLRDCALECQWSTTWLIVVPGK